MTLTKQLVASTLVAAVLAACGDSVTGAPSPDAPVAATRPPGVALCYSQTATPPPAAAGFTAALAAGDRGARAQVIDALDAAVAASPGDEQLQLYLGLAHLWRLAEPLAGDTGQLADATGARDHLRLARQLCPTDARIAAWLGPVLVRFGRALNDQATIDEGLAVLDEGIAEYPSFVLFSKLLVHADAPRDAPEFTSALDAVVANTDACAATPLDPACTNATVPHNREGAAVFLGDAFTKALRRDDAAAAFTAGTTGADFATWSFQPVLTGRVADLDARIALYANTDPADDPVAAWGADNQCALCHTR